MILVLRRRRVESMFKQSSLDKFLLVDDAGVLAAVGSASSDEAADPLGLTPRDSARFLPLSGVAISSGASINAMGCDTCP